MLEAILLLLEIAAAALLLIAFWDCSITYDCASGA